MLLEGEPMATKYCWYSKTIVYTANSHYGIHLDWSKANGIDCFIYFSERYHIGEDV